MQSAWEADLFKFAMHRTCAIAHSYSKEKRIQAIQSDADFVIINYDGLEIIKDEISNAKFDLIVVDEANAYKNVQTKRWKILASVIRPETWVWMLTGTPASQSPTDAYGLAKLINPTGVPKFFGAFRDMVLQKITQFKWIPKPSSERVVHQVLQPEEASHKVIVFAPFKHAIEIIAEEMRKNKIPAEIIHGGVSATKRTEIFSRFQTEDNPKVLVIQPQAAAHGVTLHAANVVVWWGPITSIETYLQANARVHRAGQRNPCTVVHLQGSPVEKRVYKMLSEKVDIHTRLIDLYKNILLDT
jgi:SNF2 family DNA or RNA helicase